MFSLNSLEKLQSFKCAQSERLTLKVGDWLENMQEKYVFLQSVELLMEQCPRLISCLELDYWTAINASELASFQNYLRVNNIRLKILEDKEEVGESVGGIPSGANLPENMCNDGL